MTWLAFVAGAVASWGVYGAMLHGGQVKLAEPHARTAVRGRSVLSDWRSGSLVVLMGQGQGLSGFNREGTTAATVAGALGALGAVCIIFSFRTGGTPTYVMPLVFGGAPLVNGATRCTSTRRNRRRIPCSTSASSSRRSAPGWCCTSNRRDRTHSEKAFHR